MAAKTPTVGDIIPGGMLRFDFAGNQFSFDRVKVLEAADDTLSAAGKVGVWTKADSVTLFDDFGCGGK